MKTLLLVLLLDKQEVAVPHSSKLAQRIMGKHSPGHEAVDDRVDTTVEVGEQAEAEHKEVVEAVVDSREFLQNVETLENSRDQVGPPAERGR